MFPPLDESLAREIVLRERGAAEVEGVALVLDVAIVAALNDDWIQVLVLARVDGESGVWRVDSHVDCTPGGDAVIDELLHRTTVTHGDVDDEQVAKALRALVRALAQAGARLPLRRAAERPSYHRQARRLAVGAFLLGLALVGLATLIAGCAPTCLEKCDKARIACHTECPSLGSPSCTWTPAECTVCHASCELSASGCASGCGYAEFPDLTTRLSATDGSAP